MDSPEDGRALLTCIVTQFPAAHGNALTSANLSRSLVIPWVFVGFFVRRDPSASVGSRRTKNRIGCSIYSCRNRREEAGKIGEVGLPRCAGCPTSPFLIRTLCSTEIVLCEASRLPPVKGDNQMKQPARKGGPPAKVYCLPAERQESQALADAAGLTVSTYLLRVGLGYRIAGILNYKRVEELARMNGDLGRLGGLLKLWFTFYRFFRINMLTVTFGDLSIKKPC